MTFERFTDRARRVVVLAQEEAKLLKHNYVSSDHLLLAMIHEREGLAGRALCHQTSGLEARKAVEELVGLGDTNLTPGQYYPFTPAAKKVLELALREAITLGHSYIGTEHLLLSALRDEGVLKVLSLLEVDLERLRTDLTNSLAPATQKPQTRSWAGILSDWAHADDDKPLDFGGAAVPEKIQKLLTEGVRPSTPVGMGEEIEIEIMGKTRKLVLRDVHVSQGEGVQAIFVEKQDDGWPAF